MLVGTGAFELNLSVALVLEYESTAKALAGERIALEVHRIDDILDFLCAASVHRDVYFLWRPFLSDPKDDMVPELAVSARAHYIVTYNATDFQGIEQFGIAAIPPKTFLEKIGALP